MRSLTLRNLLLALDHLLGEKAPLLSSTPMGLSYKPLLERRRNDIKALPESIRGTSPYAEEIAGVDDVHDDAGASIWHVAEAVKRSPLSTAEEKAAAERVQAALVPERKVLRAPHADEAAAAKLNRSKLSGLEADLKSIPYPGGKTCYDIALAYIEAGEKIDTLLSARADAVANAALSDEARKLRQATIKLLGNFRTALRDELEGDPALPQNLDTLLFAYMDELAARREHKAEGKGGGEKGDSAAPG